MRSFGIEVQLWASLAELTAELGRCDYWYVKYLTRFQQLLRCRNDLGKLVDSIPEALLEVTDALEPGSVFEPLYYSCAVDISGNR